MTARRNETVVSRPETARIVSQPEGTILMDVSVALLVTLEAKPGKEEEVARFLEGGRSLVEEEPDTVTWYAVRHGQTTFGIFDTFASDDGRQKHLSGAVAKALGEITEDLLAAPPDIRPVDVIPANIPGCPLPPASAHEVRPPRPDVIRSACNSDQGG